MTLKQSMEILENRWRARSEQMRSDKNHEGASEILFCAEELETAIYSFERDERDTAAGIKIIP